VGVVGLPGAGVPLHTVVEFATVGGVEPIQGVAFCDTVYECHVSVRGVVAAPKVVLLQVQTRCFLPMQNNTGEKSLKGDPIGNNVTADIAIRKALNLGIDRKALLEGVIYGKGDVEYTGVDQREFGNPEARIKDSNVEEAKKILENAGWKDTDGDGIREKNGTKAQFKLYYSSSDQTRQALSVAVSEQARDLGIKIDLVGTSWDEIYANQYSSAVLYAYSSIDTFNLYLQYHSKEADDTYKNPGLYNNPVVDGYLEAALRATDQDQATKYWQLAAYDGNTGFGPAGELLWVRLLRPER